MKTKCSLEEFLSICGDSDTPLTFSQIYIAKCMIEAYNEGQSLYFVPCRHDGKSMIKALLKTYFTLKEDNK